MKEYTQAQIDLASSIMDNVVKISRRYERKHRLQNGEVIGAAWEGALEAASKYDEIMKTKFSTYAFYRIVGNIKDYMRTIDPLSRTERDKKNSGKDYVSVTQLSEHEWEQIKDSNDYIDHIMKKDMVKYALGGCTPVQRNIVKLKIFDKMTLKEIGHKYGIGESRTCQLYKKALEEMYEYVKRELQEL